MAMTANVPTANGEPVFLQYLHAKAKQKGAPLSATFELTSRCNFNCRMCYIHSADSAANKARELNAAQWIEIGSEAAKAGVAMILLTGGEPLIRDDFAEIYTGLKKLGLLISVNTNASLLSGRNAELFYNDPPSRLNVSLYGAGNETYTSLCGGAHFDAVIANVKAMLDRGIDLRFNISLTPYNAADLERMYAIASELGVHVKATPYMYPPARTSGFVTGENAARFTAKEAAFYRTRCDLLHFGEEEYRKRAKAYVEKGEAETGECIDVTEEGSGMKCRAGSTNFWVNWQGKMNVCGMFPSEGFDILQEGFAVCWEKVKARRAAIRTPAECETCPKRKLCPVCASVCVTETGSFSSLPRYACEMSEETDRLLRRIAKG